MAASLVARIRALVQLALEANTCVHHRPFCLLTESGQRALLQPFVYHCPEN